MERSTRRNAVATLLAASALLAARGATAQVPAAEREVVARTAYFLFHSEALANLHDFLSWRTSGLPDAPSDECAAATPEQRSAFARAEQLYASRSGAARNSFIIAMRYEVAGFSGLGVQPDSVTRPVLAALDAALPAYRACWWAEHDRRNREWIAGVVPRLRQHEDSIAARLARLYQNDWEEPFPVDVVPFATATGASTVTEPHHINVSSLDPGYTGDHALEMVFHEASHTIIGSERDAIRRALRDSASIGRTQLPRDTEHVLLFYSAGWVTQQRLAETGTPGYEPYMYKEGLFERAWPQFRAPLERYWQAYLEGRSTLVDALRGVARALP